jgi:hypothetical protein
VTFELVEATPYTLRYAMTDTGQPGTTPLLNAETAPPANYRDLRIDALTAAGAGAGGLPLLELLRVGVANQGEARHLLMADAAIGVTPGVANLHRAKAETMPLTIATNGAGWTVDADLGTGPSAGYAVLVVKPPGDGTGTAYLDLHLDHSYDDGPYFNT